VSRALRRLVARKKLIVIRRPDGSRFYAVEFLSANHMPLTYSLEQPLTVSRDASPTEPHLADPALVSSLVDWVKSFVRELGLDGASQK
jgi:hypothetical protein